MRLLVFACLFASSLAIFFGDDDDDEPRCRMGYEYVTAVEYQTSYEQQCSTAYENECQTSYETEYTTVYNKECKTVYDTKESFTNNNIIWHLTRIISILDSKFCHGYLLLKHKT